MCASNFEFSSPYLPRKLVRRSTKSSAICLAENLTLRLMDLLPRLMKALGSLLSGSKGAGGQVEGVIQVSAHTVRHGSIIEIILIYIYSAYAHSSRDISAIHSLYSPKN